MRPAQSFCGFRLSIPMQAYGRNQELSEPEARGVVSLEPQPFLQCHPSAPKTQWVTVAALWYRPSDWLGGLRLLRRRFEGKGAIGGRSPFPVADSLETTPLVSGSKTSKHLVEKFFFKTLIIPALFILLLGFGGGTNAEEKRTHGIKEKVKEGAMSQADKLTEEEGKYPCGDG